MSKLHNLFNLNVCVIVVFFNNCINLFIGYYPPFSFSLIYAGCKILLCTFLSKMFSCFLSLLVRILVSDTYVNVFKFSRCIPSNTTRQIWL
jgi:hypothetical protein